MRSTMTDVVHPQRVVQRIKTTQAREEFGTMVNSVAFGGQWIVFERRDKDLAAMIPMADLRRLQALLAVDPRPAWDGVSIPQWNHDWAAADRICHSLEVDDMH